MYLCTAKNMEQFISQLSVSFPNNNKSIFTGIPIKFNLFISNNIIIRDFSKYYTKRRNPQYYSIGDRFLSVLHSRMRNKCRFISCKFNCKL
jgi:hypothetical protein